MISFGKHRTLLAVLICLFTITPSYAVIEIFDGFEDGDYTSNPQWTPSNLPYGTAFVSVDDPVNLDNYALKVHGTDQAHYTLDTPANATFAGFDLSMEFLATNGLDYGPHFLIGNENEWIAFFLSSKLNIMMSEFTDGGPGPRYDYTASCPSISPNTWLHLHMWHDVESDLIKAEVRRISNNYLLLSFPLFL